MIRRMAALLLIAISTGGVSWWLHQRGAAQSQQHSTEQQLLADIIDTTSGVQRVKIEDQNGVLFSAVRDSERWLATHLDTITTFPADTNKLAELVNQLVQMRVVETKTSNPDRYTRLGVESVRDSGAQSVLIELGGAQDVFSLLIGRRADNGTGTYVRQPEEAMSLLVDKSFSLPEQNASWLSRRVLPWGADNVRRITVHKPGRPPLELNNPGVQSADWQVQTESQADSHVSARRVQEVLAFQFSSVSPYLPQQWQDADIITRIDIEGRGAEVLTLLMTNSHGDEYIQMRVTTETNAEWFTEWEFGLTEYQALPLLFNTQL